MGRVKSKLKMQKNVQIIDRFFPSTKMCHKCGIIHNEITLKDRIFICECGLNEDRDLKAAKLY